MSARDGILQTVRERMRGEEAQPTPWRSRQQFADLAAQFEKALIFVNGEPRRAASLDEAWEALGALLEEIGAKRAVLNDEPPMARADLPARWPGIAWHVVGQTAGDLRAFCAGADVGISGADAALAETGSVAVSSGPGKSRLATLLPPVHVALVPTSRLTSDIFTWTAARAGLPPSNITLISGPSKTADIEQVTAIGVHGPKRFVVILYQD